MIKYCNKCVMPATKPGARLDSEGVCDACGAHEKRKEIDWAGRLEELSRILNRYRSRDGNYDCIIPVSGGKDSHAQTIRMLKLGMNPLCVTATTCHLTDIGRRNLQNLRGLGVDLVEVSINPLVRRKLNKIGLMESGDISWPEHATIFTVPVRLAVQMGIPLIVWGENSQDEYGGGEDNPVLTREWCERFGDVGKVDINKLIGTEGFKHRDFIQFRYPSDEDLKRVGVTGIFLGHFRPWDGMENALLAQAHGFEVWPHRIDNGLLPYENLDNAQTAIHDYFKYLKFGFSRVIDHACLQIRRGRLTREDAIERVKALDGKFPWSYLGHKLEDVLENIDMGLQELTQVCDRWTNPQLFVKSEYPKGFHLPDGTISESDFLKDRHGNLTKVNYDNET